MCGEKGFACCTYLPCAAKCEIRAERCNPMTHKQRVLAAIRREPHDRLPFCSRIELWYNYHANQGTLPHRYQGMSQWDLQRQLDIGLVGYYGAGEDLFRLQYHNMNYREELLPDRRVVTVETPHGTIGAEWQVPRELKGSASITIQTKHFFESADDYPALQHFIENTEPVENYAGYAKLPEAIGDDGVALPFAGKVPIHMLMEDYMGYEQFYYEWHDNREKLEALHRALWEQRLKVMGIAAGAPCEIVSVGGNYDEQMTPPPVFESHMIPFCQEACQILHAGGKLVAIHGDGEMRRLLELMPATGVDVVESITPQPMTSINMTKLRELWADGPAIWGGLAAVIFTKTFSEGQFRRYVNELLEAMEGHDGFILGFGDNVPTDAVFERVEDVAELVRTM